MSDSLNRVKGGLCRSLNSFKGGHIGITTRVINEDVTRSLDHSSYTSPLNIRCSDIAYDKKVPITLRTTHIHPQQLQNFLGTRLSGSDFIFDCGACCDAQP